MSKLKCHYVIFLFSLIGNIYAQGKELCLVNYCSKCSSKSDKECIQCIDNYVLSSGTCYPTLCKWGCEMCDKIQSYDQNCIKCKPSFYKDNNNNCQECPRNCASCKNKDQCTGCYPYSSLKDGKCIPTNPNISNNCSYYNCKACDKKTNECFTCDYDSKLIEGRCYPKDMKVSTTLTTRNCPSVGCQVCNKANNTHCLYCKDGYFLAGQGNCIIPPREIISKDCYSYTGCSTCLAFKKDYCLSCLSGFQLLGYKCYEGNNKVSYTCDYFSNCASCVSNYIYNCIACNQGYYFNGYLCEKISSYMGDSGNKTVVYVLVGIFVPITAIIVVTVMVVVLKKKDDHSKVYENSGNGGGSEQASEKNIYAEIFRSETNYERQVN